MRLSKTNISKKHRFKDTEKELDLDLTYVSKRIGVMVMPSSWNDKTLRTEHENMQRYFEEKHQGHYQMYSLCEAATVPPGLFEKVPHASIASLHSRKSF